MVCDPHPTHVFGATLFAAQWLGILACTSRQLPDDSGAILAHRFRLAQIRHRSDAQIKKALYNTALQSFHRPSEIHARLPLLCLPFSVFMLALIPCRSTWVNCGDVAQLHYSNSQNLRTEIIGREIFSKNVVACSQETLHQLPKRAMVRRMQTYLNLLRDVLENGETRSDRTGTGTIAVFGRQARYDLREGFPCLTTKKLHLRSIIHELLWFIQGNTNIAYLKENGVSIWDEWADEKGNLGPVYGRQWRAWQCPDGRVIDQLARLIDDLKHRPASRRHIVSAWNVADVNQMALPPCHCLFQFFVHEPRDGGKAGLSCQLYQRSADLFLGVPFNVASYALLTLMIAQVCDYEARDFVHSFGDLHLYQNHLAQAKEQLSREPRPLPAMWIDPTVKEIDGFRFEHFRLDGYDPHPAIKAPISV